jgi:hypothetical protein
MLAGSADASGSGRNRRLACCLEPAGGQLPVAGKERQMTTPKKADERAAKQGSGQGGTSNAGGTATGPGSSSASAQDKGNQREIGGSGSAKGDRGRPGHKANA